MPREKGPDQGDNEQEKKGEPRGNFFYEDDAKVADPGREPGEPIKDFFSDSKTEKPEDGTEKKE